MDKPEMHSNFCRVCSGLLWTLFGHQPLERPIVTCCSRLKSFDIFNEKMGFQNEC